MKTFCSLCLLLALLFLSNQALAAEPTKSETQTFFEDKAAIIEPGVLPTSFWYWADKFAEQIRYVFTVGKEQKADFLVLMAEERLAEMKKLSEQGITDYADQLLTEHEDLIKKAQELYAEVKAEALERGQQLQTDTEKQILIKEQKIKKELNNADVTYKEKEQTVSNKLRAFMKAVMSHLSWKKDKIQEQRADVLDE